MMNFPAELPRTVKVGEAAYAVNTDYRVMADFEIKIARADLSDKNAFAKIFSDTVSEFFIEFPKADAREIIEGLLWFYRCGKEPRDVPDTPRTNKRYYDYGEDFGYIYAAFSQQYGDDLVGSHMHWWEFRAKFMALTEAVEFVKIMQYRGTDLSKIKNKDERARIKKLQELYALRSLKMRKFASLEERNEALKQRLQKRFDEVRRQVENK